eukprot:m.213500 g.213500  ORF g.213500 m.213500 type:complete len:420 (-) comp26736_c0_seq1:504-1763(-)
MVSTCSGAAALSWASDSIVGSNLSGSLTTVFLSHHGCSASTADSDCDSVCTSGASTSAVVRLHQHLQPAQPALDSKTCDDDEEDEVDLHPLSPLSADDMDATVPFRALDSRFAAAGAADLSMDLLFGLDNAVFVPDTAAVAAAAPSSSVAREDAARQVAATPEHQLSAAAGLPVKPSGGISGANATGAVQHLPSRPPPAALSAASLSSLAAATSAAVRSPHDAANSLGPMASLPVVPHMSAASARLASQLSVGVGRVHARTAFNGASDSPANGNSNAPHGSSSDNSGSNSSGASVAEAAPSPSPSSYNSRANFAVAAAAAAAALDSRGGLAAAGGGQAGDQRRKRRRQTQDEARRLEEQRLEKNRQCARDCRQRKKEYIRMLEAQVAEHHTRETLLLNEINRLRNLVGEPQLVVDTRPM